MVIKYHKINLKIITIEEIIQDKGIKDNIVKNVENDLEKEIKDNKRLK